MDLVPIYKNGVIEKRNILNEMRAQDMTLQELRFISIYLSKINARKPDETRVVRFSLLEFQKIMELERVQEKDIRHVIDSLLCKIVRVPNENRRGYTAFQLFKECKISQTDNEEWYIEIDAHDKALPLMFNLKGHYFSYQLWNALKLKSKNQLRMYEILKQYEKIGHRTIQLDELKELLGIAPDDYSRWDNFKRDVLDICMGALFAFTDIRFEYESVKNGNKTVAISFKIEKNPLFQDPLVLDNFIDMAAYDEYEVPQDEDKELQYDEHLRFYADAVDFEFTNGEMQVLYDLTVKAVNSIAGNAEIRENMKYDYLFKKYNYMKMRAEKKPIIRRFGYMCKIIKADSG